MKLLIDAGNTRIKWALADAGEWLQSGAMPTARAGELPLQFAGMTEQPEIWVSNVAGAGVEKHIRNINAGRHNFIVAHETQCGVRNGYADPAQLGSDRWAALIAAWCQARRSCLVVNCGTAITVDALSETGQFMGGLILPGIDLMRHGLDGATAQLKAAQGKYAVFPDNTSDAVYSGAIQAACGAIQRQYAQLGDNAAPVVLAGGAAGQLQLHLEQINLPVCMADNLVLQGLLLIAQEAGAR